MVQQIGLKIKRFMSLLINNLLATSINNMENNILRGKGSLVCNKSDIGIQCLLSSDSETPSCDSVDEEEYKNNSDGLVNKRIILHDWVDNEKKPKKFKQEPVQMRPGFSNERFNETSYYFENGLRKVYPYYFTFTTYTKGRWVGKTLLEVFGNEFRAHSADEYKQFIEKGLLTVNNERVTSDFVLKHNDMVANIVHRHEVPVTNDKIDIIHIDKDIVVINKPPSIPVHPCGRYRHNTIIFVLAKEYNLKDLKTIHRLDRLTSGVLMFGRTQNKTRILEAQIRDRKVKKQYVCRVEGKFPESIECEEPIEVICYKIGVCKVSSKGKSCRTLFELIGYNEKINTSVVLCIPYSGRMHQIRVHLQYLGYPIKNDPLYNDTIFGPEKGRGGNFGKTDDQLVKDLIYAHNAENWLKTDDEPIFLNLVGDISNSKSTVSLQPEKIINSNPESRCNNKFTQTGIDVPDVAFIKNKLTVDPYCKECKIQYKDPKPEDLIMYLHAFKYSGPDWLYETPLPLWANVNWVE